MAAEWRPIPGYEGNYEVSSEGQIVSLRGKHPRVLVQSFGTSAYPQLGLTLNGKTRTFKVHKLVALAFLGPRPSDKPQIRHLDGDPRNNKVGNLRYGTGDENREDARRHAEQGRPRCGVGHDYTPENTGRSPGGFRYCIQCRTTRVAREIEQGIRTPDGRRKRVITRSGPAHENRHFSIMEDCGCEECARVIAQWVRHPSAGSEVRTA